MSEKLLFLLFMCVVVKLVSGATKCYKVEEVGENPDNIYHCYGDTPDCCERNDEFTCCESQGTKTWREQLQLWGTVAGVIAVMLLVCCCFKSDGICNGGDDNGKSFMDRFRRKKQEPELTDLNQTGHSDPTLKTTSLTYDRLPPLPPVTPLPEKHDIGYRGRYNDGYEDDDVYYR